MNRTATYLGKANASMLQKAPCLAWEGNKVWGGRGMFVHWWSLLSSSAPLPQTIFPSHAPSNAHVLSPAHSRSCPVCCHPIENQLFHRGTFSSSVAVRIKALSNDLKSSGGVSSRSPRGVQNVSMVQTMTVKGTGLQFGCI